MAMNALESGHINEKGYEDELRDSVMPTRPPAQPYNHQSSSQVSSRSSLGAHGLGLRGGAKTGTSDDTRDSPTIPSHHHTRPPSAQRYSPSMRYSSGGVSPEIGGARSIIAGSLASIDSEGSWLSGKINPRQSLQQTSPLRSSEQEPQEDDVNMEDDDYLGDSKPERNSYDSEADRKTWREGMEQRVHMERGDKTVSRYAMLDGFGNADRSPVSNIETPTEDYMTPREQPEGTTSSSTELKTPTERQTNFMAGNIFL